MSLSGLFHRSPRSAAEWVARYHAGHWSSADDRAFAAWLRAVPARAGEVALLARLDALSADLARRPAIQAELAQLATAQRPRPRAAWSGLSASRRGLLGAGLAATATVAAVTVGVGWWPEGDLHRTAIGQTAMLTLEDGSTIWLNTNSRVRVALAEHERRVTLEQGQAFFRVSRNPQRPFIVRAGAQQIVVTGTQFDVRREGDVVRVAVLEGHVRVAPARQADVPAVALQAGQVVQCQGRARPVPRAESHIGREAAWREGRIVFDNTDLPTALREINRYTPTPLVLADEDAEARRWTLSGEFRTGDIDAVVFALRELYGLQARREDGHLRLVRPPG